MFIRATYLDDRYLIVAEKIASVVTYGDYFLIKFDFLNGMGLLVKNERIFRESFMKYQKEKGCLHQTKFSKYVNYLAGRSQSNAESIELLLKTCFYFSWKSGAHYLTGSHALHAWYYKDLMMPLVRFSITLDSCEMRALYGYAMEWAEKFFFSITRL